MNTKTVKVIPADVYDALEFSALAFGGIGGGCLNDSGGAPCCLMGHMDACSPMESAEGYDGWQEMEAAVVDPVWSLGTKNDHTVSAINARKMYPQYTKVTFEEYVAERGWVRGE